MLWQKGFTWPPYPNSGLCEPAMDSWAVLELYHFSMASTLSLMMDSHSSPLLSEMPAPKSSPAGPSPHPQSPRNVRWMPLPCIVSSRCMPPPIDPPYFPVYPGVANALSPCCLGREGRPRSEWQPTIARWTANICARCLVFIPPPSMSGQSKGQKWIISSL